MVEWLRKYQYGKGDKHPGWKGGRELADNGYVWIYSPDHPNKTVNNRVLEHRLVMEKMIGRYLEPHEVVHHRNCIRNDNRPENLMLTTTAYNVGISNATRPITDSYRKKRSDLAVNRFKRDNKGRFSNKSK